MVNRNYLYMLLFVAMIFLISPSTAHASPAVVQNRSTYTTYTTTITLAFSSPVTSGNILVASIKGNLGNYPNPSYTYTFSDSQNGGTNVWTQDEDTENSYSGSHKIVAGFGHTTATASSADTISVTVTCSPSCSSEDLRLEIIELSGVTSVGAHAHGSGDSATLSVAGYTPPTGSLILANAYGESAGYSASPAAGFTMIPAGCNDFGGNGCSESDTSWVGGALSTLFTAGGSGTLYTVQTSVAYVAATTQPLRLTISPVGSTVKTFTITGSCGQVPNTILGDGNIHNIIMNPSCTVTINAPAASGNNRWVYNTTGTTYSFTSCASGTCSGIDLKYWAQNFESFAYQVIGGGSPTAPILTYTNFSLSATYTLTTSNTGKWLDGVTAWSVSPNPLTGSGTTERWLADSTTLSGTASAGTSLSFNFYHEYKQTSSYTISCVVGATCSSPTMSFSEGGISNATVLPVSPTTTVFWADSGQTAVVSLTITDTLGNLYSVSPNPNQWTISTANYVDNPIVYYFIGQSQTTSLGSSFYDTADHYTANTYSPASTGNLNQPMFEYNSSKCFSANIVSLGVISGLPMNNMSSPNGFGLISNANIAACQTVAGRVMDYIKLSATTTGVIQVNFNYATLVPTTVAGSYTFEVAYTTGTPTTVGTIIYTHSITSTTHFVVTEYIYAGSGQTIYLQFVLQATPASIAYADGCSFSTFSKGVCAVFDNVYVVNAAGLIYPHNFNLIWANGLNWFDPVTYPTTITVQYPSPLTDPYNDGMFVPVPTPDRNLPILHSNLLTVHITSSLAVGYFRTMNTLLYTGGNATMYIDDPSTVHQEIILINDMTSKFPTGTEIWLSRGNIPITSGLIDVANSFTAWLPAGSYTFYLYNNGNYYTSTLNIPASSGTITVNIVTSSTLVPATVGSSISFDAGWNPTTNSTIQVTYNDSTLSTTAITFILAYKNNTCPYGCTQSSINSIPGTYGYYTVQIPAQYQYLNEYYILIDYTSLSLGTGQLGPIYLSTINIPLGHLTAPSLAMIGLSQYLGSSITFFDLLSFMIIIFTVGMFTAKNSWVAIIAAGAEGMFFAGIGWFHILPSIISVIAMIGVIGYIKSRENRP